VNGSAHVFSKCHEYVIENEKSKAIDNSGEPPLNLPPYAKRYGEENKG
jgi:hypothetical protein